MSMSGKLFYLRGPRLIKALMLIAAKTIMLPIITKATINIISPNDDEISNFVFYWLGLEFRPLSSAVHVP